MVYYTLYFLLFKLGEQNHTLTDNDCLQQRLKKKKAPLIAPKYANEPLSQMPNILVFYVPDIFCPSVF